MFIFVSPVVLVGFPKEASKRAIFKTNNSGLENATQWIMEHIADSDFSDPFVPPGTENASTPLCPEAIPMITGMGFTEEQALKALKATNNNVERAVDWIFSHPSELDDSDSVPPPPEFRDGEGRTSLFDCSNPD